MVELDERIEANGRTIEALTRAVEISRQQINLMEQTGNVVISAPASTNTPPRS